MDIKAPAPCTCCKGTKTRTSPAFTAVDGTHYPERTYPCSSCDGRGEFPALDIPAIVAHITATRGPQKGFRKSWPSKLSPWNSRDVTVRRAYYVWRIARFHGGADVTMPMMAGMVANGDPMKPAMEEMARVVAQRVFGNHRAGATRWARAMGYQLNPDASLPPSAYEGGPVVTDGQKPWFEALELK